MSIPEETIRRGGWLLFGCIALGLIHQYMFYEKAFGVSIPLFLLLFYLLLLGTVRPLVKPDKETVILEIAVGLFSLAFAIRNNFTVNFLTFFALPFLVTAHTLQLTDREKFRWYKVTSMVRVLIHLFFNSFRFTVTPFRLVFRLFRFRKGSILPRILSGLGIAAPARGDPAAFDHG